jgi:nitroimidazol reductase NimA-like FMN-containing flavoprotein (pyridoxamine 5'-phosphate oxidase superfamily)
MQSQVSSFDTLKKLLEEQRLAVVATEMQGRPYTSLVAFAASEDLRQIVLVTTRSTTKYRNLSAKPYVSLLVDSRTHSVEDFSTGVAVTALGKATEVEGKQREDLIDAFLRKHPHLDAFARSPSTATCCVDIDTYYLVTRFQNVVEMDVRLWPS